MIAKILNNDRVYYSPVFAVNLSYANYKAIVFDDLYSKLIVVDIYERHRNFLEYHDRSQGEQIPDGGHSWIINQYQLQNSGGSVNATFPKFR